MYKKINCIFFIGYFYIKGCFLPTEHAGNTTVINAEVDFVYITFPTNFLRWTSYCIVVLEGKFISVYEDGSLLDSFELKNKMTLPSDEFVILGQNLNREPKTSMSGELADFQLWTTALTADTIQMVAACKHTEIPQIFLNRDQWFVNGTALWVSKEGVNNVCQLKPYNGQSWIILKEDLKEEGLALCRTLGGRLPTPSEEVGNTLLEEFVLSHHTSVEIHLGINKTKTGWNDTYNGQPITYWPNRSLIQSEEADVCMSPILGTWVERVNPVCLVVCETPVRKIFLKGLCTDSKFTKEMWIHNSISGKLVMREAGTFILQSNEEGNKWSLTSSTHKNTRAEVKPKTSEFPFGQHDWIVWDKECGYRGETIPLMLTPCPRDMFTCGDLSCIPTNKMCNKKPDCNDKSDEHCAKKVEIPIVYDRLLPPRPDPSSPLIVTCHADLINYRSFSIKETTWAIDLYFILQWRDKRLKYFHLNNFKHPAVIKESESIWKPNFYITSSLGLAVKTEVIESTLFAFTDGGPTESDDLSTFQGGNV